MTTCRGPTSYGPVQAAVAVTDAYFTQAALAPATHGQGTPYHLVFASFMRTLSGFPVVQGVDPGMRGRLIALQLLTSYLRRADMEHLVGWVSHFVVVNLPQPAGG